MYYATTLNAKNSRTGSYILKLTKQVFCNICASPMNFFFSANIFYPYHVCKHFILSFRTLRTLYFLKVFSSPPPSPPEKQWSIPYENSKSRAFPNIWDGRRYVGEVRKILFSQSFSARFLGQLAIIPDI